MCVRSIVMRAGIHSMYSMALSVSIVPTELYANKACIFVRPSANWKSAGLCVGVSCLSAVGSDSSVSNVLYNI